MVQDLSSLNCTEPGSASRSQVVNLLKIPGITSPFSSLGNSIDPIKSLGQAQTGTHWLLRFFLLFSPFLQIMVLVFLRIVRKTCTCLPKQCLPSVLNISTVLFWKMYFVEGSNSCSKFNCKRGTRISHRGHGPSVGTADLRLACAYNGFSV